MRSATTRGVIEAEYADGHVTRYIVDMWYFSDGGLVIHQPGGRSCRVPDVVRWRFRRHRAPRVERKRPSMRVPLRALDRSALRALAELGCL